MPMASVMTIESEVCGRCVAVIDVSVGMENRGAWICCGCNYLGFVLAGKAAQYLQWRLEMVPGIGGRFRRCGLD